MARPVTHGTRAGIGALLFMASLALLGVASIAIQVDGILWILAGIVLAAAGIALLVAAIRALLRGRAHPPDEPARPTA